MGSQSIYLKPYYKKKIMPDPIINAFRRRIYNDDNDVFLIIAGARGSTKSGDAISLGYQMDINHSGYTRFYLNKKYFPSGFKLKPGEMMPRVIYKPSQLMDMLKNHEKYPAGTCIVWDEVGVEGDARDFAYKKNKLLKRTFQTIRSLRWFIILTAVTLKDFDIAFERNAGFYMETYGKTKLEVKGKEHPYGKTKIFKLFVSPRYGKRYNQYFTYSHKGQHRKLSEFYFVRKPPAWLEDPYKRYKTLFQTKLYASYAEDMDASESMEFDPATKTSIKIADEKIKEILNEPEKYYDYKRKRFIISAIQMEGDLKIEIEAQAKRIAELLDFRIRRGDLKLDQST